MLSVDVPLGIKSAICRFRLVILSARQVRVEAVVGTTCPDPSLTKVATRVAPWLAVKEEVVCPRRLRIVATRHKAVRLEAARRSRLIYPVRSRSICKFHNHELRQMSTVVSRSSYRVFCALA